MTLYPPIPKMRLKHSSGKIIYVDESCQYLSYDENKFEILITQNKFI
jgi:hypothetical protein